MLTDLTKLICLHEKYVQEWVRQNWVVDESESAGAANGILQDRLTVYHKQAMKAKAPAPQTEFYKTNGLSTTSKAD